MTTTSAPSLAGEHFGEPVIPPRVWGVIVALGALFVTYHWHFIYRMFRIATHEWGGNWSHALIVPGISAYFIYQNSHRLSATASRVFWPGLPILFLGMFGFAWGIYPGRNDMLQGYSMIISLFGLALFLLGPAMMRVLWFPILYLALAVKISDRYWEAIAWYLQLIAARSSTIVLKLLGIDATVEGSTIELVFERQGEWVSEALNVAEACSGLRMLMAFIALGAAMAYLVDRPWWHRLLMLGLTIPIAVVVNVGRVTALGLLTLVNKDLTSGDFHVFIGILMLIPAAGLFWLVGWILDQIIIRDYDAPMAKSGQVSLRDRQASSSPKKSWALMGDRLFIGLVIGVMVTALIGSEFGFLLAIYRPEALFGGYLTSQWAIVLSVAGLVVLSACLLVTWKLVAGESGVNVAARPIATGMTVGILLMGVIGLNAAVGATQTVLIKEPVPLRKGLYLLPKKVGSWEMFKDHGRVSTEQEEALGTREYISRIYRDVTQPDGVPGSYVELHTAYYTGTPDTVPHVPDRCFVAGGARGTTSRGTLLLTGPQYHKEASGWSAKSKLLSAPVHLPQTHIDSTMFTFSHPEAPSRYHNVAYFFAANGKYLRSPDLVRFHGFDPRDRYSYYCKIEVRVYDIKDPQQAVERASSFFSAMMPEIMACLPDWVEVTEGRWPEPGTKERG